MKKQLIKPLLGASAFAAMLFAADSAKATPITIDQIIYQDGTNVTPGLLSGTLDVTVSGSTITILMRNTSPDAAFVNGVDPATMLLTGFGLQLPGVEIIGGTVEVNGGSTALNFDVDQSTSVMGNQYMYANGVIDGYGQVGVITVDSIVSSVNNGGGTRFIGPPPQNIDGPGYGALSNLETGFGQSTPAVNDTIKFVLTLNGTAPSVETINAGNVVLAFGSPESGGSNVPDGGSTIALLGSAMLGVGFLRRKFVKA